MRLSRAHLAVGFTVVLAWAQFRESGAPDLAAHLELAIEPRMPARVYLFKDDKPFRLSPVQAMLPLKVDLFYRERLWRASSKLPETLEVTCNEQSHFFLLQGRASFDIPAGRYRVEAYRGLFFTPAVEEFELKAGETRTVALGLKNWAGAERDRWLSGDDHIHLTRAPEDDAIFLAWMEAEDLSVGNFLQLQRQMDAAVQYGFGPEAEARGPGRSVRSGQESRSEFFGHVNLLGGRKLLRPLSVGRMYANSPLTFPYPSLLFAEGRTHGATVGYAHFSGSMPHSTLLMDLALGSIDFVEVFQFGVLKTNEWYELLNAGLRVAGIAGSDFPVPLNRRTPWPRYIPLLGPERTLVKARPGNASPYEAWAAGVRAGEAVVTNGPLLEMTVDATRVRATARFFRPLEKLEIVADGKVVATAAGDGKSESLTLAADMPEAAWAAARVTARKLEDEPAIQAHTNPVYFDRARARPEREALAKRWEAEIAYYRTAPLEFPSEKDRLEFFARATEALSRLRR